MSAVDLFSNQPTPPSAYRRQLTPHSKFFSPRLHRLYDIISPIRVHAPVDPYIQKALIRGSDRIQYFELIQHLQQN